MIYRIAAELVLVLHLAFIVYVTLGAFLNIRWPRAWMLHLPALAWGVLVEFMGFVCPLTTLENFFRVAAGEQGYQRGFIDHFLTTLIYPAIPPSAHLFLGAALVAINSAVYLYLVKEKRISIWI